MISIADGVYHLALMPRNSLNCYLIDNILVDAGMKSSYKKISRAIRDMDIEAHVLTHSHPDHQGSSASLCKSLSIPMWCSEKEKKAVESGFTIYKEDFASSFFSGMIEKYGRVQGQTVDKTLKEGDQIGSFKVIETPGHTRGHLSFFRERDGVLIVGDVLTNMNLLTTVPGLHFPPGLFTVDKEENKASMKKLLALEPQILCFGHGPILKSTEALKQFIKKHAS